MGGPLLGRGGRGAMSAKWRAYFTLVLEYHELGCVEAKFWDPRSTTKYTFVNGDFVMFIPPVRHLEKFAI